MVSLPCTTGKTRPSRQWLPRSSRPTYRRGASTRHPLSSHLEAPVWRAPAFPRAAGLLARAAGIVAGGQGDQDPRAASWPSRSTSSHGSSCLTKPHAQNSTSLASWPHPTTTPPWPGRDLHTGGLRHSAHDEKRPVGFLRSLGITPPPGRREAGDALGSRARRPHAACGRPDQPRDCGPSVSQPAHGRSPRQQHPPQTRLRSRSEAAAYATRLVIRE